MWDGKPTITVTAEKDSPSRTAKRTFKMTDRSPEIEDPPANLLGRFPPTRAKRGGEFVAGF
jgi:hypothetical protein